MTNKKLWHAYTAPAVRKCGFFASRICFSRVRPWAIFLFCRRWWEDLCIFHSVKGDSVLSAICSLWLSLGLSPLGGIVWQKEECYCALLSFVGVPTFSLRISLLRELCLPDYLGNVSHEGAIWMLWYSPQELILCSTICVPSATRHNIHMYPYMYTSSCSSSLYSQAQRS